MQLQEKNYDEHIRIGFLMGDTESRKEDMVFHSLECFKQNHAKIDLTGVRCVSIEFIAPKMFKEIISSFSVNPA